MHPFSPLQAVKPIANYSSFEDFYDKHEDLVQRLVSQAGQGKASAGNQYSMHLVSMACSAVLSCAYFLDRALALNDSRREGEEKPYVIHLLGATDDTELSFNGAFFSLLPRLLNHLRKDAKALPIIDVHCYNPNFKRSGRIYFEGVTLFQWAKRYTGAVVEDNAGKIDLALLLNPGFEAQPGSWLDLSQGGPVPFLCHYKVPAVVTSYGVIDSETDKFLLSCYGFQWVSSDAEPMHQMKLNPFEGAYLPSVGQREGDPLASNVGSYSGAWFDLSDFDYVIDFSGSMSTEMTIDEDALDLHRSLCECMFLRLSYYGDHGWFDFGGTVVTGAGEKGIFVDKTEGLVFFPGSGILVRKTEKGVTQIKNKQLLAELNLAYAELVEVLENHSHSFMAKFLTGMGLFNAIANSGKVKLKSEQNNMPFSATFGLMDAMMA